MIEIRNVSKDYRTRNGVKHVLRGLDFQIAAGEKVGILGRNGAGKSTLIRILSGAERPSSGDVRSAMRISWPLAFGGGFQGGLTGADNARFVARVYGADIERVLEFVRDFSELGSDLREPVKNYSAGMRARLAFALSMAVDFDCYLIDEIIAVGDKRFHDRCHEELFVKRSDRSMIIVSHDTNYIRTHCDRAMVLKDGSLKAFLDMDAAINYYEEG
jgi:capsular polysaccharide transport system ATP-binding protein